MSKYARTSSLYRNFGENRLDPIQQQQQKIDQFISPQYSAVIQVNPTQEDESWLEKVLFQQQISTSKDQNFHHGNRNAKYDYLNRNQNLYDFSKKVQSQSLIRKNIANPYKKEPLPTQKQKYSNGKYFSVQRRYNQPFSNKNQDVKFYKNEKIISDRQDRYNIRSNNMLSENLTQNKEIDENKLKKIQQKIKNYSYKPQYSVEKTKQSSQIFRTNDLNNQYDSCAQKVKQLDTNIQSRRPSHRCTPTFNENQINNIQIMRRHFQTIFNQLTKQKQMSCYNSDLSKISQDVKYLLGPIFGQLKIKKKLISKEQFILRALQLIKDYQFQQINQLLASCSYIKNAKRKQFQSDKFSSLKSIERPINNKENHFDKEKYDYIKMQNKYQQITQQKLGFNKDKIQRQIGNYRKPLGQNNVTQYGRNISPNKLQSDRKGPSKSPYIKVSQSNQPSFQIQKDQVIHHIKNTNETNKMLQRNNLNDWIYKYEKDQDLSILQKLQNRFASHFSTKKNLDNQHLQQLSFEELIRYS